MNNLLNTDIVYHGERYKAQVGSIVDEYLRDSIDSIVVDLKEKSDIDFKPGEIIKIDGTNLIIGNVDPTVAVYNIDGTSRIDNYQLSCYNPVIKLRTVITSAFSIKQPIDPTAPRKNLQNEISKLRYKVDGAEYDFIMSSDMYNATIGLDCADATFGRSNLYDVMNSLLSQINCITTASIDDDGNVTVDIKSLEIDDSGTLNGLSGFTKSQSAADYATALNVKVDQGINPNSNHLTKSEFGLTLRSPGNLAVTTDNAELTLQTDIYGIKHLYLLIPQLKFQIGYVDSTSFDDEVLDIEVERVRLDVAEKHLLEKKAFDIKDPIKNSWNIGNTISDDNQNYYIYYEMGKKNISGFGNTWNEFLAFTGMVFTAIIKDMVKEFEETYYEDYMLSPSINSTNYMSEFPNDAPGGYTSYQEITDFETNYINWSFDIEYKPQPSYKLQLGKTIQDSYAKEVVLLDKQNEAYVNIERFGDSEQIKVDRTGNKVMQLTAKVSTKDKLMHRGQTYKGFVLIHKQYSVYPNYVKFFGEFYEKYAVNNLFNGVAQKKRIYQISSDYFDREILTKYKVRFTTQVEDYETMATDRLIYAIYGGLNNSNNNVYSIGALFLDCRDSSNRLLIKPDAGTSGSGSGFGWMQFSQTITGNSVALHCECMNNSYLGLRKENTSSYENVGYGQTKVSYVDDYGEVYKYCFRCFNKSELDTYKYNNYGNINAFNKFPYWGGTQSQLIEYETIYKSEDERLGFTLQFECCVSSDITPLDIPHIADRIIVQSDETLDSQGLIVVGDGYRVPTITVIDNGAIKIETTVNENPLTDTHSLVFDGVEVLRWGSEKTIYVYIQR